MYDLLCALNAQLIQVILQSIADESTIDDDWVSGDFDIEDMPDSEDVLSDVRFYIDLLYRSTAVCESPKRSMTSVPGVSSVASQYYDQDLAHVSSTFPQVEVLLAQRLASAMSARRKEYAIASDRQQSRRESSEATLTSESDTAKPKGGQEPMTSKPLESSWSMMVENAMASDQLENVQLRTPLQPVRGRYGEAFRCPICFSEISVTGKLQWCRHVYEDILPYVCTAPGCLTANRRYAQKQDWQQHELQSHYTIWSSPFEPGSDHHTLENLYRHMRNTHNVSNAPSTTIDQYFWDLAKSYARVEQDLFDLTCPLCRAACTSVGQWYRHVGRHQEQLALFCLPLSLQVSTTSPQTSLDTSIARPDDDDTQSESDLEFDGGDPIPVVPLQLRCSKCGFSGKPDAVRQHNELVHGLPRHCTKERCGRSFLHEHELKAHVATHVREHSPINRHSAVEQVLQEHAMDRKIDLLQSQIDAMRQQTPQPSSSFTSGLWRTMLSKSPVRKAEPSWLQQISQPTNRDTQSDHRAERVLEHFPRYRLGKSELERHLYLIYGEAIDVNVSGDDFTFMVPRQLTKDEKDSTSELRWRDDDD